MLINANSAAIPLADGSVHAICTSPPYWGLRRYAGDQGVEWPAVEYAPMPGLPEIAIPGCEPACEHEWGHALPAHHPGQVPQSKWKGNAAVSEGQTADAGAYCQKCGGWRGDLGLEPTPEAYVGHLVLIARELWRVLRDDGVWWLNLGDSMVGSWGNYAPGGIKNQQRPQTEEGQRWERPAYDNTTFRPPGSYKMSGLKPKDLCMIPARVALALQGEGWYLRSAAPWIARNRMPESVTDRPTTSIEHIYLLAKSPRYFFDMEAVRETSVYPGDNRASRLDVRKDNDPFCADNGSRARTGNPTGLTRTLRTSDWFFDSLDIHIAAARADLAHLEDIRANTGLLASEDGDPLAFYVNTQGSSVAHFATWPTRLVETMLKASLSERGCCPQCGAQWRRVVDTVRTNYGSREDRQIATGGAVTGGVGKNFPDTRSHTVGWQPTCACGIEAIANADDFEIINTPTGERAGDDPSMETGRAGLNRPRGNNEGQRPITRYEQRQYAEQIKASPYKDTMAAEVGETALEHYARTDRSGARPVPDGTLDAWIDRGWLVRVPIPEHRPYDPVKPIVLDPFAGSGTTGQVAVNLGARFVGLDLGYTYLRDIAAPRLSTEFGATAPTAASKSNAPTLPMFPDL